MIQPTNMQYPQAGGANAVAINIYNPQAYGGTNAPASAQGVPYNYTNSLYSEPSFMTSEEMDSISETLYIISDAVFEYTGLFFSGPSIRSIYGFNIPISYCIDESILYSHFEV